MPTPPALPSFRPVCLRRLRAGLLAFALAAASGLRAQSATIGYSPVANADAPSVNSFVSGMSTGTGYIVPFRVNSLGDYSLTSVSLLLSGNSSVTSLSLSVSSTLPTDLTAPTALTTFTTTGALGATPAAFTFNAGATPTLTAGTTYYFRVAYTGTDTVNWIRANGTAISGSGGIPPLSFIDSSFAAGQAITYRSVTSGGFTDLNNHIGAFSITANAVSAVPEPSTYAALAGALALAAAFFVRRRRARP